MFFNYDSFEIVTIAFIVSGLLICKYSFYNSSSIAPVNNESLVNTNTSLNSISKLNSNIQLDNLPNQGYEEASVQTVDIQVDACIQATNTYVNTGMQTSARMWLESVRNWINEILSGGSPATSSHSGPGYVDVGVQTNAPSVWATVKQWFLEVLDQKLRSSLEIRRELQHKYLENSEDSIITDKIQEVENTNVEIHNMYESVNTKFDSFINKVNTLLNNSGNKSQYLDSLQSIIDGFNYEQNLAMSNILGSMFIIFSLISIISIFYGDKLILFFDLENRFAKIAKFIQMRRKFQQYYLLMNIGLILIVLLLIIYVNIIEFLSHIK